MSSKNRRKKMKEMEKEKEHPQTSLNETKPDEQQQDPATIVSRKY